MMGSLREWFDLACENYCNGHNNLYTPQLTCVDDNTAIISSIVHNEGENSAQMLINLAIEDIQARNPQVVFLSNGWMLQLNQSSPENNYTMPMSSNNNSQLIIIGVSVGVAVVAVKLLLIAIGIIFGIKERFASPIIDVIKHFNIALFKSNTIFLHVCMHTKQYTLMYIPTYMMYEH